MSDSVSRSLVLTITALAVFGVLLGAPAITRVPVLLLFALFTPGFALTRFIPTVEGVDRIALAGAISLSLNVMVSLLFVALQRWSGEPVLLVLATISVLAAVIPRSAPWVQRRLERERQRNEEIRDRKRAQDHAYSLITSADSNDRRQGLTALSWILEDEDRPDEARRLRELARLANPPTPAPLAPDEPRDLYARDAHARARSLDPETRRRGLIEVAGLLDDGEHSADAETLRALAENRDL